MRLLTALLFISLITKSYSCSYSYVSIWPPTNTIIPTNPCFIITMIGGNYTDEIRAGRFMYLVSTKDTVKFKLTDTIFGKYAFRQAIIKPERPLKENTYYTVLFDTLLPDYLVDDFHESFTQDRLTNSTSRIYTHWKTGENKPDTLLYTPDVDFINNEYVGFGTSCFKLRSKFSCTSKNPGQIIYKLTFWHKNKIVQQFYAPYRANDSLIYANNDMFNIQEFRRYKVSAEAMNTAGIFSPSQKKSHTIRRI